uniref:Uncharacterized protein n=1 Tax=Helianthus annuus TaxID=4232 RepID=A0A251RYL7_HELAN
MFLLLYDSNQISIKTLDQRVQVRVLHSHIHQHRMMQAVSFYRIENSLLTDIWNTVYPFFPFHVGFVHCSYINAISNVFGFINKVMVLFLICQLISDEIICAFLNKSLIKPTRTQIVVLRLAGVRGGEIEVFEGRSCEIAG